MGVHRHNTFLTLNQIYRSAIFEGNFQNEDGRHSLELMLLPEVAVFGSLATHCPQTRSDAFPDFEKRQNTTPLPSDGSLSLFHLLLYSLWLPAHSPCDLFLPFTPSSLL